MCHPRNARYQSKKHHSYCKSLSNDRASVQMEHNMPCFINAWTRSSVDLRRRFNEMLQSRARTKKMDLNKEYSFRYLQSQETSNSCKYCAIIPNPWNRKSSLLITKIESKVQPKSSWTLVKVVLDRVGTADAVSAHRWCVARCQIHR
jgi:hypothetical protein